MAMFTAYFDASGDALKQPYVVVSGYIANYLQWKSYENMWTRIHDDHGVKKPFHMAEFVSALSNPKYAQQKNARPDYIAISQDPKKARSFLLELCITQATYVNCVVTCVVPMDVYNGVSLLLDLRTVIPPYALGARMCIERVHGWERMFSVVEPVECIFEEGDFEQGKFTELMVKEGWAKPIYKKKNDYAGLQGSDQYAWEVHNYKKEGSPIINPFTSNAPQMVPLSILGCIPALHIQPTQESLINLCHDRGIDPKTGVQHDKPLKARKRKNSMLPFDSPEKSTFVP